MTPLIAANPDPAAIRGLVGMMLVRNEAGRYLEECLTDLLSYCEAAVVLDDASDDATPQFLAGLSATHPWLRVYRQPEPTFWRDESSLRKALWQAATGLASQWVICLDADEMLEGAWKGAGASILAEAERAGAGLVRMNLFEFWGDRQHYRVDGYWNPAGRFVPTIMRFRPGHEYMWNAQPLHGGRFPVNPPGPHMDVAIRIKHYGYADPRDHLPKYQRYLAADPQGRYCALSHYQSIIGPAKVVEWQERPQ